MPKYFNDEKALPSEQITFDYDAVSGKALEQELSNKNGNVLLSVKLPGLPENSLGYVFIVQSEGNTYSVIDIKEVVHFQKVSSSYLSQIIRHAAGIEFDTDIQAEFHRIRNEIGID